MIRRIIFSLKGWGVASLLLAIALLYQHFFRNPLCFSWNCIIWFLLSILGAVIVYSFILLPVLPNKKWLKNMVLSILFLASYYLNLFTFETDYSNNLLLSDGSKIAISLLIVFVACFTTQFIKIENKLVIRQVSVRKKEK